MVEACYSCAKDVYEGHIQKSEAVKTLTINFGMKSSSAVHYIDNFQHMMKGEEYNRTNNHEATEYYLSNIQADYGVSGLRNALLALDKHIVYYESLGHGNVVGQRQIYHKYFKKLGAIIDTLFPDEIRGAKNLFEGASRKVYVNSYERNSKARKSCLKYYGYLCAVCKFDFSVVYGEIGDGFIHVHHLVELSTIKKKYKIDPIKDLRPVCPNCHAMLHKSNPPYTIKELRKIIVDNK